MAMNLARLADNEPKNHTLYPTLDKFHRRSNQARTQALNRTEVHHVLLLLVQPSTSPSPLIQTRRIPDRRLVFVHASTCTFVAHFLFERGFG